MESWEKGEETRLTEKTRMDLTKLKELCTEERGSEKEKMSQVMGETRKEPTDQQKLQPLGIKDI